MREKNKSIGGKARADLIRRINGFNPISPVPVTRQCPNAKCTKKPTWNYCGVCRNKIWNAKNPLRKVYRNLKSSAYRRFVPFLLTLEEFKEWCEGNGYMELRGRGKEGMTVDRIWDYDEYGNKAPYSLDNIQMLSKSEHMKKRIKRKKLIKPDDVPF